MGPTASGKTGLAEDLAGHYSAQLINADAFQVYRGFDIGTAKPEHHERYLLIDIREPHEQFGVGEFVALAQEHLKSLWEQQRSVILVGGTGLYIRALMEEYTGMKPQPDPALREELQAKPVDELLQQLKEMDPKAMEKVDAANPLRVRRALERALTPAAGLQVKLPPFFRIKLAIDPPKDTLNERIRQRCDQMFYNGFVEEVRRLRLQGVTEDAPAMRGIGYRSVWRHLEGQITLEEARDEVISETRKYAKRQRTWLRSEPNLVRLDTLESQKPVLVQAIDYIDSVLSGDIGDG